MLFDGAWLLVLAATLLFASGLGGVVAALLVFAASPVVIVVSLAARPRESNAPTRGALLLFAIAGFAAMAYGIVQLVFGDADLPLGP